MFQWLKKQHEFAQRIGGLQEKKDSTQRKIDVATKILDRRSNDKHVPYNRRRGESILDSSLIST